MKLPPDSVIEERLVKTFPNTRLGGAVAIGGAHSLLVPDRFEKLRRRFYMTVRENRASR